MCVISKNLFSKGLRIALLSLLLGFVYSAQSLAAELPNELLDRCLSLLPRKCTLRLIPSDTFSSRNIKLTQGEVGIYFLDNMPYFKTLKGAAAIDLSKYPPESLQRILTARQNVNSWGEYKIETISSEDQAHLLQYVSGHNYTLSDKDLAVTALVCTQWCHISYNKIYQSLFNRVANILRQNNHCIFQKIIGARNKVFKLEEGETNVLNRLVRSCIWKTENTPESRFESTDEDIKTIMDLIGQYAYTTNRDLKDGNTVAPEGSPLSLVTSRYSNLTPEARIEETIEYVYKHKHIQGLIKHGSFYYPLR